MPEYYYYIVDNMQDYSSHEIWFVKSTSASLKELIKELDKDNAFSEHRPAPKIIGRFSSPPDFWKSIWVNLFDGISYVYDLYAYDGDYTEEDVDKHFPPYWREKYSRWIDVILRRDQ